MTVVNWNVEWATPRSWSRRDEILSRIEQEDPNIVCLTESDIGLLAGMSGHLIHSQPDGVKGTGNLRKVLLWSREPWEQVDDFGEDSMPPGKFVSGVTRTPLGYFTVLGSAYPTGMHAPSGRTTVSGARSGRTIGITWATWRRCWSVPHRSE